MLGKTVYKEIFRTEHEYDYYKESQRFRCKRGIGIRIRDTDLREIRVNVWKQCSDEKRIEQKFQNDEI